MLQPHLQRYPMLELLMTSHGSSGSCGLKQGTGCSRGLRAINVPVAGDQKTVQTQKRGKQEDKEKQGISREGKEVRGRISKKRKISNRC